MSRYVVEITFMDLITSSFITGEKYAVHEGMLSLWVADDMARSVQLAFALSNIRSVKMTILVP